MQEEGPQVDWMLALIPLTALVIGMIVGCLIILLF